MDFSNSGPQIDINQFAARDVEDMAVAYRLQLVRSKNDLKLESIAKRHYHLGRLFTSRESAERAAWVVMGFLMGLDPPRENAMVVSDKRAGARSRPASRFQYQSWTVHLRPVQLPSLNTIRRMVGDHGEPPRKRLKTESAKEASIELVEEEAV